MDLGLRNSRGEATGYDDDEPTHPGLAPMRLLAMTSSRHCIGQPILRWSDLRTGIASPSVTGARCRRLPSRVPGSRKLIDVRGDHPGCGSLVGLRHSCRVSEQHRHTAAAGRGLRSTAVLCRRQPKLISWRPCRACPVLACRRQLSTPGFVQVDGRPADRPDRLTAGSGVIAIHICVRQSGCSSRFGEYRRRPYPRLGDHRMRGRAGGLPQWTAGAEANVTRRPGLHEDGSSAPRGPTTWQEDGALEHACDSNKPCLAHPHRHDRVINSACGVRPSLARLDFETFRRCR